VIRVYLKYMDGSGHSVIRGIRRVSRPGLRRYAGYGSMPRVLGGAGVAILSTSKGVITSKRARQEKVGGEVLCEVW
jgi:small subunit ribosomal protein S8